MHKLIDASKNHIGEYLGILPDIALLLQHLRSAKIGMIAENLYKMMTFLEKQARLLIGNHLRSFLCTSELVSVSAIFSDSDQVRCIAILSAIQSQLYFIWGVLGWQLAELNPSLLQSFNGHCIQVITAWKRYICRKQA